MNLVAEGALPTNELAHNSCEIIVPAFDVTDAFWLDVDSIHRADELVTSVSLSTMAMAAETHADELSEIKSILKDALISEDDPLAPDIERIVSIGVMYGAMIVTGFNPTTEQAPKPRTEIRQQKLMTELIDLGVHRATNDLNIKRDDYGNRLFARLRQFEINAGKSDVLAVGIAKAMPHMGKQLQDVRAKRIQEPNRDPAEAYTSAELTRLQAVFYSGVLAGALTHCTPDDLNKQRIEILRSPRRISDTYTDGAPIQPDIDLPTYIDRALSSKTTLRYESNESRLRQRRLAVINQDLTGLTNKYVAVYPRGYQVDPSSSAEPLNLPGFTEPDKTVKVPIDEIEGLLISKTLDRPSNEDLLELTTDKSRMPSPNSSDQELVGILTKKGLVAAFDNAHPNYDATIILLNLMDGLDAGNIVINPSNFFPGSRMTRRKVRYAGAVVATGAMIGLYDTANFVDSSRVEAELFLEDLVIIGAAIGGVALGKLIRAKHWLPGQENHYRRLLDQIHKPR